MKVINDNMTILDFNAWSGAVDTKKRIISEGLHNEFDRLIEELYPDGIDETRLNDILWFEEEFIFESLGITDEDEEEEVEG